MLIGIRPKYNLAVIIGKLGVVVKHAKMLLGQNVMHVNMTYAIFH
jgi:transcription antitermination factor NusA-like protein